MNKWQNKRQTDKGCENVKAIIKLGKYRHYKGKEYEVLQLARHSETLEEMVVYRALYDSFDIWVRPASMWQEEVTINGQTMKRFERID